MRFGTDQTMLTFFNMVHLQKLEMHNDNLERLMANWTYILSGMKEEPTEEIKRLLWYHKIQRHHGLGLDIAHYRRLHEGHPEKTFVYLWGIYAFDTWPEHKNNGFQTS